MDDMRLLLRLLNSLQRAFGEGIRLQGNHKVALTVGLLAFINQELHEIERRLEVSVPICPFEKTRRNMLEVQSIKKGPGDFLHKSSPCRSLAANHLQLQRALD